MGAVEVGTVDVDLGGPASSKRIDVQGGDFGDDQRRELPPAKLIIIMWPVAVLWAQVAAQLQLLRGIATGELGRFQLSPGLRLQLESELELELELMLAIRLPERSPGPRCCRWPEVSATKVGALFGEPQTCLACHCGGRTFACIASVDNNVVVVVFPSAISAHSSRDHDLGRRPQLQSGRSQADWAQRKTSITTTTTSGGGQSGRSIQFGLMAE